MTYAADCRVGLFNNLLLSTVIRFSSVRKEMCEFVDCCPDMVEGRNRKGVRRHTVVVGPESAFLTQCMFFCFCSI